MGWGRPRQGKAWVVGLAVVLLTAPFHPTWQMRCCGVTDYTDWYPVLGENTVPDRCCMENSQGCGRNATTPLWRTVRLGVGAVWCMAWHGRPVRVEGHRNKERALCGVGGGHRAEVKRHTRARTHTPARALQLGGSKVEGGLRSVAVGLVAGTLGGVGPVHGVEDQNGGSARARRGG